MVEVGVERALTFRPHLVVKLVFLFLQSLRWDRYYALRVTRDALEFTYR